MGETGGGLLVETVEQRQWSGDCGVETVEWRRGVETVEWRQWGGDTRPRYLEESRGILEGAAAGWGVRSVTVYSVGSVRKLRRRLRRHIQGRDVTLRRYLFRQ